MQLLLIDKQEFALRIAKVRRAMAAEGLHSMLVSDNANLFYLTGRVFRGYIYIAPMIGEAIFVRRPTLLQGENVHTIHKPENIIGKIGEIGLNMPDGLGLELNEEPYSTVTRLAKAMNVSTFGNADNALMAARMVKTDAEIDQIKQCAVKHDRVYRRIPHLYEEGMTDLELMVAVEREARLEGSIGILRTCGHELEINMGSVLTGDNADTPSPYDFAMGGAGTSPALPMGADGSEIRPGMPVMIDMNGCFNGYMTDMTRVYAQGPVPEKAQRAHRLSIEICRELAAMGRPGAACSDLYNRAVAMAQDAGFGPNLMGHASQAGFVGHGVGICVNELPVIAPRSRHILTEGNVIALEPKFVLPGIGAVGIENTYVVTADGLKCLTDTTEEIINLDV